MPDQPITEQQLADIEARALAATEGPWEPYPDYGPTFYANSSGEYLRGVGDFNFGVGEQAEADEAFVKHAQQDVTALLVEIRRRAETIALLARWECGHGVADDEPFCAEAEDEGHVCPTIRVHPADAEAFAALVDEAHRLRTDLAPYEMLAPQQCPAGKHADWLVDSEYAHACPWCEIEKQRAELTELKRPGVEAKRNEIRDSYAQSAAMAREDRDHEGAFTVECQLREREEQWVAEDAAHRAAVPAAGGAGE